MCACKPSIDTPIFSDDSSALASHHDDRNYSRKPEKLRHNCDHCGMFGHKIDKCYALLSRPPRSNAIAQTDILS